MIKSQWKPLINFRKYFAFGIFLLCFALPLSAHAAAWQNYRAITVTSDTNIASGTQPNFPMLVNIPSSSYLQLIGTGGKVNNASGYDIIFSSSNSCGSPLSFEREKYNATTGQLVAWVKVPSLAASSVIYLCYGNTGISADQSSPSSVWDSNYKEVQHLSDNAANTTVLDSTSNAHNGVNAANTSTKTTTSAQIPNALTFNGTNDFIDDSTSSDFDVTTGDMTIEMWVYRTAFSGDGGKEILDRHASDNSSGYSIGDWDNNGTLVYNYIDPSTRSYNVLSSTILSTNTWYHLVVTQHAAVTSLYINGALDRTFTNPNGATGIGGSSTKHLYLMQTQAGGGRAPGRLDEFRFSTFLRPTSWILTEYNNQNNPGTFYSIGSETAPPIVISPTTLPDSAPNVSYSQNITVAGGSAPYTWSLLSGTLPTGLTLNTASTTSTTTISGTPTVLGTYNFTVKAVESGSGQATQAYTINIATTAPSAPQNFSVIPASTKAYLSWSAPASDGGSALTHYLVYDRQTGGGSFNLVSTLGPSVTSTTISSLTNGQSYDFEVVAQNAIGDSSPTSIIAKTPAVPTAATCYAVTSGNWNDPSIWSSSLGGTGGNCGAVGGQGLPIMGSTLLVSAGVPGAAGNADLAIIKTGVTVHITAGLGVEMSNNIYNGSTGDAVTIHATDQTTYGSLVIDNKGLLEVHGASGTNDNYMRVDQYAVFQIMPGGSFWIGNYNNVPNVNVYGRFYSGCLDQTTYPTPFCAGNAGGWVTASTGASNNITAVSSLPSGLAVGDLVELNLTQSPTTVSYPYAINGTTPPPTPPVLPTTNDSGISPMKTCGSVGSCPIPESTPVCVVGISGSSITLGWPQGGTTAKPYCTGAETAINITSAGSGQLWLNKPAFMWGDPSQFTWSTAVSQPSISGPSSSSNLDGTHTGLMLGDTPVPISNAAGTGPGRIGDNSLTLSLTNPSLSSCSFLNMQSVTSSGCYINYDKAYLLAYGYYGTGTTAGAITGSLSYTGASGDSFTGGHLVIPSGTRQYNSLVLGNTDIRYLMNDFSNSFIQVSNLDNTTNRKIAFSYNTLRMSNNVLGFGDASQSTTFAPTNTFQVIGNSWFSSSIAESNNAVDIDFWSNASNFDISQNHVDSTHYFLKCGIYTNTAFSTFTGTITNNDILDDSFIAGTNTPSCNWTGNLIQDNRITGTGTAGSGGGGTAFVMPIGGLDNPTPSNPNLVKYNILYGTYRGGSLTRGTTWDHNIFLNQSHHGLVLGNAESSFSGGLSGGGEAITNNIFAAYGPRQALGAINLGFIDSTFLDGITIANNTILGSTAACVELGDTDPSFGLLINLNIYNNICAPASDPMFIKYGDGAGIMSQRQLTYIAYNALQGSGAPFAGITNNPNNIPNPEYNRDVIVTNTHGNYNADTLRNVTGVAIQNPTYSTNQTGGALKFTHTSNSNMTLAWALDGVTYGTAAQLNWGGSGQSYTISNVTDPGNTHQTVIVSVTGTPFGVIPNSSGTPTGYVPTNCPMDRWALMTSGTNAGTAYAIVNCASSNSLAFAPHTLGIANGDTFVILKSEARLFDSGGTNYVDVGIDARTLPTTTQTDTGINLTMTDYCSNAACGSGSVVSGLPTTFTAGVTSSPISPAVYLPASGGSAEAAFASSDYVPSGSAWKTASNTGSYIGAIAPTGSTPPGFPTSVSATAGNAQATVTFIAPVGDGGSTITGYTVTSIPSGGTDSNAGSTSLSHIVTGLTNLTSYTFTVTAHNSVGTSSASSASNAVTPSAPFTGPTGSGGLSGGTTSTSSATPPPITTALPPPITITTSTSIIIPDCNNTTGFSTSTGQSCTTNTGGDTRNPSLLFQPSQSSGGQAGSTTYNFGVVTLAQGSVGNAVKELQRFLNNDLHLTLVVDGQLGPKTIAIVKKWQKAHGLVPDGVVGPKTKQKMLHPTS
jgi:hypothetical protein